MCRLNLDYEKRFFIAAVRFSPWDPYAPIILLMAFASSSFCFVVVFRCNHSLALERSSHWNLIDIYSCNIIRHHSTYTQCLRRKRRLEACWADYFSFVCTQRQQAKIGFLKKKNEEKNWESLLRFCLAYIYLYAVNICSGVCVWSFLYTKQHHIRARLCLHLSARKRFRSCLNSYICILILVSI